MMSQRPTFIAPPTTKDGFKSGSDFSLAGCYTYDGTVLYADEDCRLRDGYTHPIPKKDEDGNLYFPDAVDFHPNMTPKEIIQAGCFGGGYYRPIKSAVTGLRYDRMWEELPQNWLEGTRHHRDLVSSVKYKAHANKYGRPVGGSLDMWEQRGWIKAQDPYGWFQWYCRYYLGRRSPDDNRQITRWINFTGAKGRWKISIVREVEKRHAEWDDHTCAPGIRQILIHWAYQLTEKDYLHGLKNFPRKNKPI